MAESQPVEEPTAELQPEVEDESEPVAASAATDSTATEGAAPKKKTNKPKSKVAALMSGSNKDKEAETKPAGAKMTPAMIDSLLEANPSLKSELATMEPKKAADALKQLDVSELLTGMSIGGKNAKDMASYKFWQTQPVPRFDEKPDEQQEDGEIKKVILSEVATTPPPLPEGFEWCELDLTKDEELQEVYNLLTYHYVEDEQAMFRFNYSKAFLSWALKAPGWKKCWHVGVRATKSRALLASIFGIPTKLRVRNNTIPVVEINFLCIHKKLRAKRLSPVLIKEVTRKTHLEGISQAVYTAGVVLPRPVSTCRYYHRSLDWLKLYEVGFSGLPAHSTKARMVARNQLPSHTTMPGLRPMTAADIDSVLDLLSRYLKRFDFAQEFTRDEIEHWLMNQTKTAEDRVVWAYVVGEEGKVTDLVSFYCLESSIIKPTKHDKVRAAYLFYYASETAFVEDDEKQLKERLQTLIGDALVEAKKAKFDVFNALTLQDNPLFLDHHKFGGGDGQLHYYLFNWRTSLIAGGVDKSNKADEKNRGGIGMVML